MTQIADAPWIREAENDGIPPFEDFDTSAAVRELEACEKQMDTVVDYLLAAEDALIEIGLDFNLRDLIREVENAGTDIRLAADELKRVG